MGMAAFGEDGNGECLVFGPLFRACLPQRQRLMVRLVQKNFVRLISWHLLIHAQKFFEEILKIFEKIFFFFEEIFFFFEEIFIFFEEIFIFFEEIFEFFEEIFKIFEEIFKILRNIFFLEEIFKIFEIFFWENFEDFFCRFYFGTS